MQILKNGYNPIRTIGVITSSESQKRKLRNEVNLKAKVKFFYMFLLLSMEFAEKLVFICKVGQYINICLEISSDVWYIT